MSSRRRPPDPSLPSSPPELPAELGADITRAGYYPALVADVVATALADEQVRAHLVHQETTFDSDEVRRHVTVLALTPTRLIVAHADDHGPDAAVPTTYAAASSEAVPLQHVRSVVVSHVVTRPERYVTGTPPREVTLTICWGSVTRLDLEPASCADPDCEADHGYTGTTTADDIVVRVSAEAEGDDAVAAAVAFARALSAATGPGNPAHR
ncbi:DUF5998 family protein [Thalassiella azotivora]